MLSLLKIPASACRRHYAHEDGAALVALGDDLEQQVCAELVDREVPELIADE